MKKTRSLFLGILCFSVVLILATGCFRPAAPDVTPTPSGGVEEESPGGSDLEMTAIANSTRAAQTLEAQTAEAPGEEGEGDEEEGDTEEAEPVATATTAAVTTTEAAPTPTPAVALPTPTTVAAEAAPTAEPVATMAASGSTTYVVRAGDTLYSIAVSYGTTVNAISQANGITDPSQIYVGQTLTIPTGGEAVSPPSEAPAGGTTYVVQPADPNLYRIALRYNISWQRLAAYNGIAYPYTIYPGMVLKIPPQ